MISSGQSGPLLRANNLTGVRGTEKLFEGLSFELCSGQLLWLRGPNGSGKTTLLRLLTGISQPEVGQITWGGEMLNKSASFHTTLLYLGHSNGLKDDLTVVESLQFLASIHGRNADIADIEVALRKLNVFHRRNLPVRMLSQGQRKRVALARLALERAPGLWILDEPFDALDDKGVDIVSALFQEHLVRGGSIILTSHIPLVLDGWNVRVLQLEKGGPR